MGAVVVVEEWVLLKAARMLLDAVRLLRVRQIKELQRKRAEEVTQAFRFGVILATAFIGLAFLVARE